MVRLFSWKKALKRFGRSRRGSAAVELAAVLAPFFLLTGGLAEVAMIGFAQASLDFAVSETAREIRTGRAQQANLSATDVKEQVCLNMSSFLVLRCDLDLFLDINRFTSYAAAANGAPNPIQNGQFQPGGFRFAPGGGSDIVVVRAYYRWGIMTPFFETFFANAGHDRIIVSTMMFRNEPFGP